MKQLYIITIKDASGVTFQYEKYLSASQAARYQKMEGVQVKLVQSVSEKYGWV